MLDESPPNQDMQDTVLGDCDKETHVGLVVF